jgi:hypothetical protein
VPTTVFTPGLSPIGAPRFDVAAKPQLGRILAISGVTRDANNSPLGGCTVHLFRTRDDVEIDQMTSDGSGNYSFVTASPHESYYVTAYLPGSPDVAGVTVNTLVGS